MKKTKKVLTEKEQRLSEFQADYSPAAVVLQGLQYIKGICNPLTMLDCAAGAGIFAKCGKLVWPGVHVTSIEPREEEKEHLLECSDVVIIDYLENQINCDSDTYENARWDLIITNPPFCKIAPKNWREESWVPKLLKLLKAARIDDDGTILSKPFVGFYALDDVGQRSVAAEEFFREYPPCLQLRVCGPISHRADGKVDQRDYSWWFWDGLERLRDPNGYPMWLTVNLPRLSSDQRRLGNHELDILQ